VNGEPFVATFFSSAGFADMDGDGDEDVLVTGAGPAFVNEINLYLNNGVPSSTNFANELERLRIFPNPVIDHKVRIQFNAVVNELITLRIFNLEGKQVYQRAVQVIPGSNTLELPVSKLKTGMYQISLGNYQGRFVVGR
jgi:hypothetical protein